ncbi:extracellular solute-binding protein, partial [Clavibacter michiganensis]|uniref:extracellular solute-binding protein n=1 Tax=Clavibacter michiganensis TaxID=28447 RepID=UPI00292E5810
MGQAAFPTQNGQEPGYNSMSGGWTLAVGKNSKNPQAAFDFISTFLSKDGSLKYDTENSQIAVRKDVAEDPEYTGANPTFKFFSDLVQHTNFRPATSDYSQVSNAIQVAMESV